MNTTEMYKREKNSDDVRGLESKPQNRHLADIFFVIPSNIKLGIFKLPQTQLAY